MKKFFSCIALSTLLIALLGTACTRAHRPLTERERSVADSLTRRITDTDSLLRQQQAWQGEGKLLESISALRQIGKIYREQSRFADALVAHSSALKQAETLGDTLSIVLCLNDLGTDYRRLDRMSPATEYHFKALKLSEACSDTTFQARKNRVISLNGLANVYLTVGNYERADSALRIALAGERELGSPLGQAINYANIGSIFEHKGELDSARFYYERSMECNRRAKSDLGIGLCYNDFSSLYEKEGKYPEAIEQYTRSYDMMSRTGDDWHTLNALLALANIYEKTGQKEQTLELLERSKRLAEAMHSHGHLSEVYRIYYHYYLGQGDYRSALNSYVRSSELSDSVVDMQKINRIQNISLDIERTQKDEQIAQQEQILAQERRSKQIGYAIAVILVLLSAVGVCLWLYVSRLRRRTYRQLKALSKMREEFFTNVTHEFRTPLTVIGGLSREMADNEQLTDELREEGRTINRQSNTLLQLINQLLDIAKVKSATGSEDYRRGDIFAFLQMVAEGTRAYAQQKDIELVCQIDGHEIVDFVPDYMVKIVNNLVSNAVKFTPKGGRVCVEARKEADKLHLTVSDTGIGIAPEHCAHLFEPFYQVNQAKQPNGSGIGLALVYRIVTSLGGSIEVQSTPGEGSAFTVLLPLASKSDEVAPLAPDTAEPLDLPDLNTEQPEDEITANDAESKRILVIEDNADVARYIGSQLPDGYDVYYAPDGKTGVDRAKELIPDAIITDIMMPGMDGYEVCRAIRQNELTNHIPIVVVSARVSDADRIAAFDAGSDAYLTKPFNSGELQALLAQLLAQRALLYRKYSLFPDEDLAAEAIPLDVDEAERVEEEEPNDIEAANTAFLNKMVDAVFLLVAAGEKTDIPVIAERLFMSESQLYRKVSAITGMTPAGYILQIKLTRAKQLMQKDTQRSLVEISEVAGFTAYSGFVRAFKKMYGITPSAFKRDSD